MHSRCFPVQIPDSKSDRGLFISEPIRATRVSKEGCRAWNSPQPLEKKVLFFRFVALPNRALGSGLVSLVELDLEAQRLWRQEFWRF